MKLHLEYYYNISSILRLNNKYYFFKILLSYSKNFPLKYFLNYFFKQRIFLESTGE